MDQEIINIFGNDVALGLVLAKFARESIQNVAIPLLHVVETGTAVGGFGGKID